MSNLQQSLQNIGLSLNETNIYLVLLKLGPTTHLRLSEATGIKRSTVYVTVDSLIEKGLIFHEINNRKKLLRASDPNTFSRMLDQKRDYLTKILPELSALYQQLGETNSLIRHYQGLEGIKSIYRNLLDTLNPGDYYLVISDQQKWYELDPVFFERFIRKRANLKLDLRLILQQSQHALCYQKKQSQYNETIKIIDKENTLKVNTIITPKQVIYIQIISPVLGLVIENENIVNMNKSIFEMLWETI